MVITRSVVVVLVTLPSGQRKGSSMDLLPEISPHSCLSVSNDPGEIYITKEVEN